MTFAFRTDGGKLIVEKRGVLSRLPFMYSQILSWLDKGEPTTAVTFHQPSTTASPVASKFQLVLGSFRRVDDITAKKQELGMSVKLRSAKTEPNLSMPRWLHNMCTWKFDNGTPRPTALKSICPRYV